jgi:pimeloyl-ACP methyl ester carboxylesterase
MHMQPFTIDIPQSTLDDVQRRLAQTRWPDEAEGVGWAYGTNRGYLKELVDYWQRSYDWRAQEARLNQLAHFHADIDGSRIHFIHMRGKGPNPTPLLLIHGWPDSFYRFHKIIPQLSDPASFGGNSEDSFDVIVPSLPGFGFSDRPNFPGGMKSLRSAELLSKLMHEVLGYQRYAVAGGDIGSRVTRLLALAHPEQVVGIHLTDIGFPREIAFPPEVPNPSPAEGRFLGSVGIWFFQEGAYAALQTTKPQTISYALSDSPVGLAGWIVEKFRTWSDCDGEIEKSYTKDELLTNIMIYWVTGTISSSARLYHEDGLQSSPQLSAGQYIEVPAGVATFPKDLTYPPRELGERFLRVARWTEMPRGGHFAALEVPELLVADLRAFLRPLRGAEAKRGNGSERSA